MHDPWASKDSGSKPPAISPDVQAILDEFLNDPARKIDLHNALAMARTFIARVPQVGILLALAEVDDRDMRVAMAKALKEAAKK